VLGLKASSEINHVLANVSTSKALNPIWGPPNEVALFLVLAMNASDERSLHRGIVLNARQQRSLPDKTMSPIHYPKLLLKTSFPSQGPKAL
jgi:hypothetical protein